MTRSTVSDTEELPIAAHVFEGYLYIRDDKADKWAWRLFRFDGTSLTCLSSKKIKLPPHTLLDNARCSISTLPQHNHLYSLTNSGSTHSFTSPILATPKNKTDRILAGSCSAAINNRNTQPISASYYQLPKWTIDMINISSISLLNPKHRKPKGFFTSIASSSKAFTIRTFDGACYTLKAGKQHDLERWIFILVKTWKFAQAARHMHNRESKLNRDTALSVDDSGSTSDLASIRDADRQMTSPVQASQQQHTKVSVASHAGQQQSSKHHHNPMLTNEKALWIEEWVKSLAELDAYTKKVDVVNRPSHISSPPRRLQQSTIQICNDVHKHKSSKHLQAANSARVRSEKFPSRYNSDCMSYFQDVNTVYTNDTKKSTQNEQTQSLKFHNSVRGRSIRSHSIGNIVPIPLSADVLVRNPRVCSPLDLLEYKCSRDRLIPSPPATPVAALGANEDLCLADVCKSLQHMEINKIQAQQKITAKRRSAILMVNASRRGDTDTNERCSSISWAPSISTKDRNNRFSSTAAFT
ncbi:hypothetical protein BD408DRAFT_409174 [Parasitella parasitica]|nr:hypothetical protein BD408DRAFT_409174 [Parasitella parasitica]